MSEDHAQTVAMYLARLHSLDAADLGKELHEILREPTQNLPRLSIFVPEVGLMLTRVMFLRDYEAVSTLLAELEGPLQAVGALGEPRIRPVDEGDPDAQARVQYFLGRLVALLVTAKRFALLDRLERLRQEHLDGSLSQAVLELLREGARSQRSIRTALSARATGSIRVRQQDLHQTLKRLSRDELVAQRSGSGRAQIMEVTDLGQQLLQEAPPWVVDVEEAYRSYRRLQGGGVSTSTERALVKLFMRLDREGGLDLPHPTPGGPRRSFPYIDRDQLPPEDDRGLPRIIH